MASLFKKLTAKTPSELVKALKEVLDDIEDKPSKKQTEELNKYIQQMKGIIQGATAPATRASPDSRDDGDGNGDDDDDDDDDGDDSKESAKKTSSTSTTTYSSAGTPSSEHAEEQQRLNETNFVLLSNSVYDEGLLYLLVEHIDYFEFEKRMDAVYIFTHLVNRTVGTRAPTIEHILRGKARLTDMLVHGYDRDIKIAICTGAMLRCCLGHEPLAKLVLNSAAFWDFFRYVQSDHFDLATDAFTSFHDTLTVHKDLVAEFLKKSYDKFFGSYAALMSSTNFVTKKQSIKLLGEVLLDRTNFDTMMKYIASTKNLKQIMILLRDKSRPIQYEAFHLFKVFVANPKKTQPIVEVLRRNKDALVLFLQDFQNDRTDEDQFTEEKAYLIEQIKEL